MKNLIRMNKCFIFNRACLLLALIMSLGFWSSAVARSFPETIPLPPGFQPEGITLGNGHTAYVGSLAGGSIYEIDLRTGAGNELVPGVPGLPELPGMIAVGLDFDARSGYLFVAGGLYGDGRVYDTGTGGLVGLPLSLGIPGMSWINDVVVTQDAAYFTNSFFPEIYKVPLDSEGAPSGAVEPLVLHGDWFDAPPGPTVLNANGIVATPNGRTLIVVNYATGRLYTVDPDTGFATEIDLGEVRVWLGDGLVLRGKTLYVVQNFANPIAPVAGQVAVFKMSPDYSAATLTRVLTVDGPFVPSTADLFGPWLYAVNARFDACFPGDPNGCPPDTEFEIVRVDQ